MDSDIGNSGVQIYTDDEICELLSRSTDDIEPEDGDGDDGEEDEEPCPVTNSDAPKMFDRCLAWLKHQPEVTIYNTSVLRELHALAAKKRMQSIKQTKLDKYFAKVQWFVHMQTMTSCINILCMCIIIIYVHVGCTCAICLVS